MAVIDRHASVVRNIDRRALITEYARDTYRDTKDMFAIRVRR